jgi:hypothetical protein
MALCVVVVVCVCMCVCLCVYVCVYVCVCIYVSMCVCVCVCMGMSVVAGNVCRLWCLYEDRPIIVGSCKGCGVGTVGTAMAASAVGTAGTACTVVAADKVRAANAYHQQPPPYMPYQQYRLHLTAPAATTVPAGAAVPTSRGTTTERVVVPHRQQCYREINVYVSSSVNRKISYLESLYNNEGREISSPAKKVVPHRQ